ncbi:glycosyl hydrolase 53 family protein [Paenibacillus polymyxa]|uniref:glycosyl hydrolase 53 family protein n=1 Tax=Paenibacillus polymyxa TaxID=1406 RepID=UPI002AB3EDCF|nr:glycosyl hydrolase 53 family protein [Paenibacillus polymyxa]MDY8023267.1 glycosyl hydrolase 53 family protein [Paenibacillus polymyxa]
MDPEHAELLSLESGLKVCKIAKELGLKVNPEIMAAYTYMDSFSQQAPNFKDYPEITQPNKPWSEYNLEEMKDVLEQYGELVAKEVVESGCEVEFWNIGNEANFGFGGVNVGLKTAVNPILENKTLQDMYTSPSFGAEWLKENVWNYNGQMMAALANGIKKVDPDAKFSTHITTAMADTTFMTSYYKTLAENGYKVDQVGISFYPTSMSYFFKY